MNFPKLYIVIDNAGGGWLGNATQRNKTSAKLTKTGAPRLFTRRSAATQAMNAWRKGEHYQDYKSGDMHHPFSGDYEIVIATVWGRNQTILSVIEIDLVTAEEYIDVVHAV
jgi:hypothetical protein